VGLGSREDYVTKSPNQTQHFLRNVQYEGLKKNQIHADIISSLYTFAPLLGANNLVLSRNPEIFV